jgi:hypothetical protein
MRRSGARFGLTDEEGEFTAIVTHKYGDKESGSGFYEMARALGHRFSQPYLFWAEQVQAVFKRYDAPSALLLIGEHSRPEIRGCLMRHIACELYRSLNTAASIIARVAEPRSLPRRETGVHGTQRR